MNATWTSRRALRRISSAIQVLFPQEEQQAARRCYLAEALERRVLLAGDRFEENDTRAAAADLGVIPGVHIPSLDIDAAGDDDWYKLQLLRPDSVTFTTSFIASAGNLDMQVTDATGTVIGAGTSVGDNEAVALAALSAGTYYLRVFGVGSAVNSYGLSIDPTPVVSTTRVFFVNDAAITNGYYTTAVGNNANTGLTPTAPKATLQSVLDTYDVGPTDLILVDTGAYSTGATINGPDEGAVYAGTPAGSTFSNGGFQLVDADFNVFFGLRFSGSATGIYAHGNGVSNSVSNAFRANTFTGTGTAIQIDSGSLDSIVANQISGSGTYGVYLTGGGTASVLSNSITGRQYGIYATGSSASSDTLVVGDAGQGNTISSGTNGIVLSSYGPNALIRNNTISSLTGYGIDLGGTATVYANVITEVATGIYARNSSDIVYGNTIQNSGTGTGIVGYGTIGGANWSAGQPNDLSGLAIGIDAYSAAVVRFNQVHGNATGIRGSLSGGTLDINHNLVYRNTVQGILVTGRSGVSIASNTIYTPAGDGIRVQTNSSNITVRNNILWTASGYDLYVATDSQNGFASDYNNLFTSGSGKVAWFQKDFTDLFDWQVEADYDSNSIGYTAPAPTLDQPFTGAHLEADDYTLLSGVTSIDAGDPASAFSLEPAPDGGRIDLGAYGNTPLAGTSRSSYVELDYPNYYTDWEENTGHAIRWHTFDLIGNVKIELFKEGFGKVADVASIAASLGSYGWYPALNGITGNTPDRYRIVISSVSNPSIADQSREPFSVPASGSIYYVDDSSDGNDEYTASAFGYNRNTGKTSGDPKANLLPLLRNYDLGPGDTVQIDTGNYVHVRNVILSGIAGVGDDEGATFTGPTNSSRVARIDRANSNSGSTNIDLNDADFVTIRYLTLVGADMGIWVHNSSTNFSGSYLTVQNNARDGIALESDASASSLDSLTAFANGRYGIYVATPIASLNNSKAYSNANTGIYLSWSSNPTLGNALVENNEVYNNGTGMYVSNTVSGTTTVIGNSDLSLAKGNKIYNNTSTGINAYSHVLVTGNTVYGQSGGQGISLQNSAAASFNVVHSNYDGIASSNSNSLITNNRVYNNSHYGISSSSTGSPSVRGNVMYSNSVGVYLSGGNSYPSIANNLIYANVNHGILLSNLSGTSGTGSLVNNTIYQVVGDAVRLQNSTRNISLLNNILWVQAGYGIVVDSTSQTGFASDYNDLFTTGSGKVGSWQTIERPTFSDWQNAAFTDQNSLAQDPLFVNPAGANGQLGFFGGVDYGTDDDFHLQSTNGSMHGGSQAPVISGVTGLPIAAPGTLTSDGNDSPGLDRGSESSAYANEPAPNGSFINLGSDGNTAQASRSPSQYVRVVRPDGGEIWPAGQNFPIRWRSESTGTYSLDLMQVGNPSPVLSIATGLATGSNEGSYSWLVPTSGISPAADYLIRVTKVSPSLSDQSNAAFTIGPEVHLYYVNDNSQANDEFTTAVGNDGNSGLDAAHPKATLQAVLQAYDLGPTDTIRIDAGTYSLSTNIVITSQDAGVKIEGPAGAGLALLNRGNTSSGSYVFELQNADSVTLDRLSITGAQFGIYADSTAPNNDSDNFTLSNSKLYGNNSYGVLMYNTNDSPAFTGNTVYSNGSYGISLNGNNATVSGNSVYGHSSYGISTSGAGSAVSGNTVYSNTNTGIQASGLIQVTGNTVYGNKDANNTSGTGIGLSNNGGTPTASGNSVYGNYDGITTSSTVIVQNNRIYNNSHYGIAHSNDGSPTISGNVIYSNSVGLYVSGGNSYPTITNNLIYANANQGILLNSLTNASGTRSITNNTIYQVVGDAIRLQTNTRNVSLLNNILQVQAGYCIYVDNSSQTGFNSDYNNLRTTGTGKLGSWQGVDFTTLVDWFYEVGFDQHSMTTSPQFVDIDGTDNVLGFSTNPAGAAQFLDDGDAGFVLNGSWTNTPGSGYGSDYQRSATSGTNTTTWTISGLTPGRIYHVAATWPAISTLSTSVTYNVSDGAANVGAVTGINQRNAPGDFSDGGASWKTLGYFTITSAGTLIVTLSNQSSGTAMAADAVRVQEIQADRSADDNFSVPGSSPTLDAGHPQSYYLSEPAPNGGRINLGYTGNTAQATPSASQLVQVLSPNGYEKFETGQNATINWRSSGLTQNHTVALINAGAGGTVDNWLSNTYQTLFYTTGSFTNTVDTSGVTNPAPQAVYQSYAYATSGVGNKIAWSLPVPDGTYTIRLHFAGIDSAANQRKFDVKLQGATVQTDYDIRAIAGAQYKATVLSFAVNASGGSGISLELVNKTSNAAVLSAIELTAANASGVASPTVNLQLSTNGGSSWSTIATSQTMDRFGRGSFNWTASPVSDDALIRVVSNDGLMPQDNSDQTFVIANNGTDYYVNDTSTSGDSFTSAAGDNAYSGKTPDRPMKSLFALLSAYDLDANDVIHVDNGTYSLIKNIVIDSQDTGVRIEGPAGAGVALLNRGNTASGSYVFELQNADSVTLDRLSLTGAQYGIYADSTAPNNDSDNFTLSNSRVYGNSSYGLLLYSTNDSPTLTGNTIYSNGSYGMALYGANAIVSGNTVYGHSSQGISVSTSSSGAATVSGNTVYNNNSVGISVSASSGATATVSGNTVYNNGSSGSGIFASGLVQVTGNTVYGQSNGTGIQLNSNNGSPTASGNIVYGNSTGIETSTSSSTVSGNRVYNNSTYGIYFSGSPSILGNYVYSNSVGIYGSGSNVSSPLIANNLIYANANQGILLNSLTQSSGTRSIVNNTIYQVVGDAIRLQTNTRNVSLLNNILQVQAGYCIYVDNSSQTGFNSDYNMLQISADPNAHIGFWTANRDTLAAWQGATSKDANSLAGDPLFLDINGADNVLGYSSAAGGYDGGRDDNFYRRKLSPATDRGFLTGAPTTDIEGFTRVDDPGAVNYASIVDLGAYEFRGSSLDVTPPNVTATNPSIVDSGGGTFASIAQITLTFSESLNTIDANAPRAYELRGRGTDSLFGTADDAIYSLTPSYSDAPKQVLLSIAGGALQADSYQLTVFSNASSSLHDLSGLLLDGDANGGEGGNYVRTFTVTLAPLGIWTGLGDGIHWHDPLNWTRNTVPGSTEDVIIDIVANPTVIIDQPAAVHSITSSEALTISDGGTLTLQTASALNGTLTLSGGTLSGAGDVTLNNASNTWSSGILSGSGRMIIASGAMLNVTAGNKSTDRIIELAGTLAGDSELTIANVLNWSAGAMSGTGKTIIASGATLSLDTTANKSLARRIDSHGTTNWLLGKLVLDVGGTFANHGDGGVFNASSPSEIGNVSGGNLFANGGTFNQLGSGPTDIYVEFESNGTINLDGAGGLRFRGNTVDFSLTGGTVTGAGDLTISDAGGEMNWTDGTITGGGELIVASGATMTTTGSRALNRALTNNGTVNGQNSLLLNAAVSGSGTFHAPVLGDTIVFNSGGNHLTSGSQLTGGGDVQFAAGTSTIDGQVNGLGRLYVVGNTANATFNGPVSVSAALALVTGGIGVFNNTVNGNIVVDTATAEFNAATTASPLSLRSGALLRGTGTVTAGPGSEWTGGTMSGSGKTVIAVGATLDTTGVSATKTLSRTLENRGTINWTDGTLNFLNGTLDNLAGAIFNHGASTSYPIADGGGTNLFNNAGTFNRLTGGGTYIYVPFNNGGTLNADSQVRLFGGGTSSGTFDSEASGAIAVHFHSPAYQFGATTLISGPGEFEFATNEATNFNGSISGLGTLRFTLTDTVVAVANPFSLSGSIIASSGTGIMNGAATAEGVFSYAGGKLRFNANLTANEQIRGYDPDGWFEFNGNLTTSTYNLFLGAGMTAKIGPGGGKVLRLHSPNLIIDPAATLDLNDNVMIVDYSGASPAASINGLLNSGYAGGAWNGTGIISSVAAANSGTAIGLAEAVHLFSTFPASFAGQSVDSTALLLQYTLAGDATFDRKVNTLDFNLLAGSFGGSGKVFSQGDFNYSGVVDSVDFNILIAHYGKTLPALGPVSAAASPPASSPFARVGVENASATDADVPDDQVDGQLAWLVR